MDKDFSKIWFDGFSEGIDHLDDNCRSTLLKFCAKNCADSGVVEMYKKHYDNVSRDRDAFFSDLYKLSGIKGKVIVPGKQYEMYFLECLCDLHTAEGVDTPNLCECSRQSIIYVCKSIWGDVPCRVETIHTVLGGADECKFKITFE